MKRKFKLLNILFLKLETLILYNDKSNVVSIHENMQVCYFTENIGVM